MGGCPYFYPHPSPPRTRKGSGVAWFPLFTGGTCRRGLLPACLRLLLPARLRLLLPACLRLLLTPCLRLLPRPLHQTLIVPLRNLAVG